LKYLIPLTNKGPSAAYEDNVLTNDGKVFIMDNHRLALWCWFQKMQKGKRYNLLHIDAHPDMSESGLSHFHHDLWSLSLDEYRTTLQADINVPLFRWDNYLEIFVKKFPELVGQTFSATHKQGSDKELSEEIPGFRLPDFMNSIFSGKRFLNDLTWIVNVDLDYFYSSAPEKLELFSDEFVSSVKNSIELGLNNGMIETLTISLSPECCGSWNKAEVMLKKIGYQI
jgi:hypothetical protein